MKRFIYVLLTLLLSFTFLTGCYDKREIDDETYVVAMGVDIGTTQPLRLTLRYALTQVIGSGSADGKTLNTVTIDAPTLNSGITAANGFVGKRIELSHAIVIVFSKEIAEKGISQYMYGIARGRQYRPSIYIAVSRTSAEDYLNSINPIQEVDPSKYLESLYSNFRFTGYTSSTQFFNFYTAMTSSAMQPTAVLAGVGKFKSSDEFKSKLSAFDGKKKRTPTGGEYKAGDIPKVGDMESEIMGLAVFNGDKMVGELDGEETRSYLMVTGKYDQSYIIIPDPLAHDKYILLRVAQSRKPQHKVTFENGKLKIAVEVKLEGDFVSIQSGNNYESSDKMPIIEAAVSKLISSNISTLLKRTSTDFNSDIVGFGKCFRKTFLTNSEWDAFDWLHKYKDSTFTVSVDYKIRRSGLLIRTSPVRSSENEKSEESNDNSK